jgi:hypothetical protein
VSKALVAELGIDMSRYSRALDSSLYKSLGLRSAFFFDKETYGADRLVSGDVGDNQFRAEAPVGDTVRRDLKRLLTERFDPMPGLSSAEKKARLARMSYTDFVTKVWKLDAGVLRFYQTRTHGLFGVGVDAVPAQDAFGLGLPGFAAMGLDDQPGPGQNFDSIRNADAESYYFHFPDGGATMARLLVRRLIPDAIPGSTLDDVVTARADYAKLDVAGAPVRIRLSSPVMRVRHRGAAGHCDEATEKLPRKQSRGLRVPQRPGAFLTLPSHETQSASEEVARAEEVPESRRTPPSTRHRARSHGAPKAPNACRSRHSCGQHRAAARTLARRRRSSRSPVNYSGPTPP